MYVLYAKTLVVNIHVCAVCKPGAWEGIGKSRCLIEAGATTIINFK